MKPKTEPSLEQLRQEIEELKKQKERKLQIVTSMTERNKLLNEIQQLKMAKKSPSALKKFWRTFIRELKTTKKILWSEILKVSRNLDKNAPELKEFSKTMTAQPSV